MRDIFSIRVIFLATDYNIVPISDFLRYFAVVFQNKNQPCLFLLGEIIQGCIVLL